MILKDADPTETGSTRAQAGARAERDMAFYLRRAFGNHRPDVFVLNDLRVEYEGEVAQIDHLVLHVHGLFVIESKSVNGEVHILPDGQFVRTYGGRRVGMPSPILQAQRQADLLRRLLQAHKTELRGRRALGLIQGGFTYCPIEVRVAISDRGIIRSAVEVRAVQKADAITADIEDRLRAHHEGGRLLNFDMSTYDGNYSFTKREIDCVAQFLLARHVGRSPCESERSPATSSLPERSQRSASEVTHSVQYLCSKCQSLELRIVYGKYGYYFKCRSCLGNTWIDTRVDGTHRKGRVRKVGRSFYLVDPDSGTERLIFTNPDDAT